MPTHHLPRFANTQPPSLPAPPPCGTVVTADEPAWTRHRRLEIKVHIRVSLGGSHSVGLDKWVRMQIHHYNIAQSSFMALKIICVCLFTLTPYFLKERADAKKY